MAVRAKMRVVEMKTDLHLAKENGSGPTQADRSNEAKMNQVTVVLQPVFGGENDAENREWSKWTPSGEVRLCITNPEAYKQFKLGHAYHVDFTPTEG